MITATKRIAKLGRFCLLKQPTSRCILKRKLLLCFSLGKYGIVSKILTSPPNQHASFTNRRCLFYHYRRTRYLAKLSRQVRNLHQQVISRYEVFIPRQPSCLRFFIVALVVPFHTASKLSTVRCKGMTLLGRAIAVSYDR